MGFRRAFAAMIAIDQRMPARADAQRFRRKGELRRALERFLEIGAQHRLAVDHAIGRKAECGDIGRGELDILGIERQDRLKIAPVPGGVIAAGEIGIVHGKIRWAWRPSTQRGEVAAKQTEGACGRNCGGADSGSSCTPPPAPPPGAGQPNGAARSCRALRGEMRMHQRAAAAEHRALDDLVVPRWRERLGFLVRQQRQQR